MNGRDYNDFSGMWNIEKDYVKDYEIEEKIVPLTPLQIANDYLYTAEETHKKTEECENVIREIFRLISIEIDEAVRFHRFSTTIVFNWDIVYVNDVIATLKELGYHAELISKPEYERLYIKW